MKGLKGELGLIWAITAAIVGMNITVMTEEPPVSISSTESVLAIKRFDPDNPPSDVSKTFHGVTKWKFECPCEVKYKVLERFDDEGGCFVKIKVTNVKAALSMPLTMWMPDNPPRGLKAHEDGHVEICKQVYEGASKEASDIAEALIGKTYSGTGQTINDASEFASGIAVVDFSNEFESRVAKKAQNISEIYDYLAKFTNSKQDNLVDEAFKLYERGKPRQVVEGAVEPK